MFDTLTESLDGVFKKLRQRGKLHPKQVDNALADIRTALLEADVAVEVADDLIARVRARALSEEVLRSLTPAQQVVKVVDEELTVTLGGEHRPFTAVRPRARRDRDGRGPGLGEDHGVREAREAPQGQGPSAAARRPPTCERPAAVEQLRTLGREIGVPVWSEGRDPVKAREEQREGGRAAPAPTS